jgi:hypothetical protein
VTAPPHTNFFFIFHAFFSFCEEPRRRPHHFMRLLLLWLPAAGLARAIVSRAYAAAGVAVE